MDNIIKKVKAIIDKYELISYNDKVVVGVSGGPDSICLLDILIKLKTIYNIQIMVAHVNHMLREEAVKDQNYVEEYCKQNNIPCFIKKVNVLDYARENKISTEEAGRIIRYKFFDELFETYNANKIAVAHNADDRAETLIMNLFRGSGLEGLKSIEYTRDSKIIRPVLCLLRSEIEGYCKVNNLNPVIDITNFENEYTRNKIRNILIPIIKDKFNPNIIRTLNNTIEILQNDNAYIESEIENQYNNILILSKEDKIKINIIDFNHLHFSIKSRLIRFILEKLLKTKKGIEYSHINQIINLIECNISGKKFSAMGRYKVLISFNTAEFTTDIVDTDFSYDLMVPGTTHVKELNLYIKTFISYELDIKENHNLKVFDYEQLKDKKLVARNRKIGDQINLHGMTGTKKLKEFFIDTKVPASERDKIPLISYDNEILWILGYRRTKKHTKSQTTKGALVIEYEYKL